MIDSKFIIRYTDALYSTDRSIVPRYDEFRDMFSSGQIKSKEWLVKELEILDLHSECQRVCIVGAWFGTLGLMLKSSFRNSYITLLDIDPRCKKFNDIVFWEDSSIISITDDMYNHKYDYDIVINTSCEHIYSLQDWLNCIPKGTTVVLQTNNFFEGHGHVNCVSNLYEFIEKTNLSEILYSGTLILPMYSRFMIIGKI